MARVISSVCLVALLVGWGATANGATKPPIAILGLEVFDNGTGIDPDTTKAAKDLTAALRERAKAGTGPYAPVPGGEKELIDEKLLNNCDSEAPTCMAAIGSELGAEVLLYGKIEKSTQGGALAYKVSLKLLNVSRKALTNSIVETVPASETTGTKVSAHARNLYSKLLGISAGGTVVIKANVDRGTVLLDDELKGSLTSGTFTIGNVADGRHTLAIEAKDHQRYEVAITVRNGETLPHSATLAELPPKKATPPPPASIGPGPGPGPRPIEIEGTVSQSRTNVWKPIFYTTLALDAGAIGYTIYEWSKANDTAPPGTGNGDCGGPLEDVSRGLKDACSHYSRYKLGIVVSSVLGAAVIGSFVMAYVRDSGGETRTSARGQRKRRELMVTPIVTPDGASATLRFDW